MNAVSFTKMHGLGNDFVVIDARTQPLALSAVQARAIADRRLGVGCDQLIVIEPSASADAFLRILNADGGEVSACGNASRCIGAVLMAEKNADHVTLETRAGALEARQAANGVAVDMGPARLGWQEIPLAREMDTAHVELGIDTASGERLSDPVCVSMGNPHAVFFVRNPQRYDLATIGPVLEHDALFPERANITLVEVLARDRAVMRTWERGAGLTLACGTAACATLVAAHRRGLMDRKARLTLPGGDLEIEWRHDGHVIMSGPVATSFAGFFDLAQLMARA